jgi:hypothetical protein
LRGLGCRLRGHGGDARRFSSRDRTLQTMRLRIVAHGYANLVRASSRPRIMPISGKNDWAVDAGPPETRPVIA